MQEKQTLCHLFLASVRGGPGQSHKEWILRDIFIRRIPNTVDAGSNTELQRSGSKAGLFLGGGHSLSLLRTEILTGHQVW